MSISGFTIQRCSTADMRVCPARFFPSRHSSMPQHTSVLCFHILTIQRGQFSKCFLAKFSMHLLYSSYSSYNPVLSFKIHGFSYKTVGPLSVMPWLALKYPLLSEDNAANHILASWSRRWRSVLPGPPYTFTVWCLTQCTGLSEPCVFLYNWQSDKNTVLSATLPLHVLIQLTDFNKATVSW